VNWKCKACAVAMTGVCVAHALSLPDESPETVLFYQSDEHPERQPVPQPRQENRAVAVTSSSAIALDYDDWWATLGMHMTRVRR
jgi:hypothetical protein